MAQVIDSGRAQAVILRHALLTVTNATVKGGSFREDAEHYLREPFERAKTLQHSIEESNEAIAFARARQAGESQAGDELVHGIRDDLNNLVGRKLKDPLVNKVLPHGASDITERSDRHKAVAMRRLASALEEMNHPKVPQDTAAEFAVELRSAADALAEATGALDLVVQDGQDLAAKLGVVVGILQIQLRRLKKRWAGDGLTDQEIHKIIPDGRRTALAEPETAATADAEPVEAAPAEEPEQKVA